MTRSAQGILRWTMCVALVIAMSVWPTAQRAQASPAPPIAISALDIGDAMVAAVRTGVTISRAIGAGGPAMRRTATGARWQWPLPAPDILIAGFDGPAQPWLPGHRGVDLAGFTGAPVRAVAQGTVSYSGVINGVGIVSVMHADGVLSTYQPVVDPPPKGTAVNVGQGLGTLAAQGSHCYPLVCLHLGARREAAYLDPMIFLDPWVVSLLPSVKEGR